MLWPVFCQFLLQYEASLPPDSEHRDPGMRMFTETPFATAKKQANKQKQRQKNQTWGLHMDVVQERAVPQPWERKT